MSDLVTVSQVKQSLSFELVNLLSNSSTDTPEDTIIQALLDMAENEVFIQVGRVYNKQDIIDNYSGQLDRCVIAYTNYFLQIRKNVNVTGPNLIILEWESCRTNLDKIGKGEYILPDIPVRSENDPEPYAVFDKNHFRDTEYKRDWGYGCLEDQDL